MLGRTLSQTIFRAAVGAENGLMGRSRRINSGLLANHLFRQFKRCS
jgi:hypothetical protein